MPIKQDFPEIVATVRQETRINLPLIRSKFRSLDKSIPNPVAEEKRFYFKARPEDDLTDQLCSLIEFGWFVFNSPCNNMIPHLGQFSFGDNIYHIMRRSCCHFIELYYLIEMGYYHFIEKHIRFYCSSSKSIVDYVYSVHTAGRMK